MSLHPRRLATFTIASALAVTGASTVVAAEAAPRSDVPSSRSVVLATYNIRHALSDATAAADVERLSGAGADVIALQEMGSRRRRDAVQARVGDEFGSYMPNGAGPGEVPILFRSSELELLEEGTQKVSDATHVGPSGAGPSTIAPKYLVWVKLQHRLTGEEFYVINSHAVASVQGPGGGPNNKHQARLRLFRQHMDGLKALIATFKATGAAVFTTGDFNVNYRRDVVVQSELFPYYNMKGLGVYASYKHLGTPSTGTHGGGTRLIDYVSATDHPRVEPEDQQLLFGYASDHRPVLVRYSLTAAPPGVPSRVRAEPMERSAQVSWTPPTDNGSDITGYTVTVVQTGKKVTVSGDSSSATVPDLKVGNRYSFTVKATNEVGTSASSPRTGTVKPFAVPPQTTITSGPQDGEFVTSRDVTFGYSSSVGGSTFTCTVDGTDRACRGSTARMSSLAQRTHTFTVTARDGAGDVDTTPATRSWTVPLDSSDLTRSASWTLRTGHGYYLDTYARTTQKYAVLRRQVSGVRKLALVATKGPGQGTVEVYLGSELLRRVSLDAGTLRKQQVVPLAEFGTDRAGEVRVVVVSSGKPVRIEGLGVAN